MPPKKSQAVSPCKGCARSKEDSHDTENSFCIVCSRRPSDSRPDNYLTLEAYRNLAMKMLYGR